MFGGPKRHGLFHLQRRRNVTQDQGGGTGVSMHALAAMQVCGFAGDMQIADAHLGGIFNMGGSAVANYVSILERIK